MVLFQAILIIYCKKHPITNKGLLRLYGDSSPFHRGWANKYTVKKILTEDEYHLYYLLLIFIKSRILLVSSSSKENFLFPISFRICFTSFLE